MVARNEIAGDAGFGGARNVKEFSVTDRRGWATRERVAIERARCDGLSGVITRGEARLACASTRSANVRRADLGALDALARVRGACA